MHPLRHRPVRRLLKLLWLGLALPCAVTASSADVAIKAPSEAELTRQQLQRIHDALADAHPGAVPGEDPSFKRWLEDGLRDSRRLAAQVRSADDRLAVLRYYTTGFRDGHVGVGRASGTSSKVRWTGWRVALRGEDYVVDKVDSSWPVATPALGAKLLDCDGRSPQAIAASDLAPFNDRRVELESTRMHLARYLTVDARSVTTLQRRFMQSCRFALPDGRKQTLTQEWREPTPSAAKPWLPPAQEMRDLGNGVYWVHVSNFQPNAEQARALEAMLGELRTLHEPRLIVFDTRGNQGGDSGIGKRILEAALGDYSRRQSEPIKFEAVFRVSPTAIAAMDQRLQEAEKSFGADSLSYRYITRLQTGLIAAQQDRQTWFAQAKVMSTEEPAAHPSREPGSYYRGRIALITDSYCGSSCLDFVDQIVAIPDAVHLGLPTGADTIYNEVAYVDLGGDFQLVLPLKVFRQRTRGNNQPWIPRYRYAGDIYDTEAVQRWTLETLGRGQ